MAKKAAATKRTPARKNKPKGRVEKRKSSTSLKPGQRRVQVTYAVTSNPGVNLTNLDIGHRTIALKADQDPADPTKYATRGDKTYSCIEDRAGLLVSAKAVSMIAGWSLEITKDGAPLADNPIYVKASPKGRADHKAFHH